MPLRARARARHPADRSRVEDVCPAWEAVYLNELEENGGQKTAAAKKAGVVMSTIMRRRQSSSAFEQAEREALQLAFDVLESEAIRRAVDGVETRRVSRLRDGTVIEHVERKYSDTILLRLLEKHEAGSWRQKQQIEHSGGMTFKTRAERKEALEKARLALGKPAPVEATHGRS
jgi:hypothetical protein